MNCWKVYDYLHGTVNHSKHFEDPQTGVCTNSIEGHWNAVKCFLPKCGQGVSHCNSYFQEYMYRKQYLDNYCDPFQTFLGHVLEVYHPHLTTFPASSDKKNQVPTFCSHSSPTTDVNNQASSGLPPFPWTTATMSHPSN